MINNLEDWGKFFLRLGLAITLLIAAIFKFLNPGPSTDLFQTLVGFGSTTITYVVAVFLLLVALSLVLGWQIRIAMGLMTLYFAITIITGLIAGGFLFTVGPAIWKDFTLLGASIALYLFGSGHYAVEKK